VFEAIGPRLSGTPLPRVSPDGRFVAFQVLDGIDSKVMVYDVVRGSTNRLTQSGSEFSPAWRPNGRELAIGARSGGRAELFLADLGGARTLLVTGADTFRRNASWSPDGETLAYTVQSGGLHDIWVLPMGAGATPRPHLKSVTKAPEDWRSPNLAACGRTT
jgi:TolB protein